MIARDADEAAYADAMERNADALRAAPRDVRDHCLMQFVQEGDIATASFLVGLGAHISLQTLRVAAKLEDLDTFEVLLTLQNFPVEVDSDLLVFASAEGLTRAFCMVMARGRCDIHAGALRCASRYGHLDILRVMVGMGADLDANECCAIREASLRGHVDAVRILADAGASVDHEVMEMDMFSPVRIAALQNDVQLLDLLIEKGTSLDVPNLVFCAILGNSPGCVESLLEAGAAVTDACIPLAEERGWSVEIIELLRQRS